MHKNKQIYGKGFAKIISGKWRGRNIYFPASDRIRPTPNRTRETLFNWLQQDIQNSLCLDMFAGSGALSFEALSRGAAFCLAIDSFDEAIDSLHLNKNTLNAELEIIKGSIPTLEYNTDRPFDIVFIDPPFHKNLILSSVQWLQNNKSFHSNSIIYIEHEVGFILEDHFDNLEIIKRKKTKETVYLLVRIN